MVQENQLKFPAADYVDVKFYPEEEFLLPITKKILTILRDNDLNYKQCECLLMLVHRELLGCRFVLPDEKS